MTPSGRDSLPLSDVLAHAHKSICAQLERLFPDGVPLTIESIRRCYRDGFSPLNALAGLLTVEHRRRVLVRQLAEYVASLPEECQAVGLGSEAAALGSVQLNTYTDVFGAISTLDNLQAAAEKACAAAGRSGNVALVRLASDLERSIRLNTEDFKRGAWESPKAHQTILIGNSSSETTAQFILDELRLPPEPDEVVARR
jgi:hypothetical protein